MTDFPFFFSFFSFALQFLTQNALETGDLSRGPPPQIRGGKIMQNTTRIYNLTENLNEPWELSKRSTFKSYTEQEWEGDEIEKNTIIVPYYLIDIVFSTLLCSLRHMKTWRHFEFDMAEAQCKWGPSWCLLHRLLFFVFSKFHILPICV